MVPGRVRRTGPRFGGVEGQLGPEHGGQAQGAGGLGEADHAVEAVVVGDGQGLEAQPGRLLGQGLGLRRAVEERERRVAVQFGVGLGADRAGPVRGWRVGLAVV